MIKLFFKALKNMDKHFFKVLKNNLECVSCEYKDCPIKYYPEHYKREGLYRKICEKEYEKKVEKALNSELP